jgi:hypothetical protein
MPLVEIAVPDSGKYLSRSPRNGTLKRHGEEILADRRRARKSRLDSDRVAAEHRPETVKVNEFEG